MENEETTTNTSDHSNHPYEAPSSPNDDELCMEDVEVGGADPDEVVMTEVVGGTVVDVPGTMNKGLRTGSVRKCILLTAIVVTVVIVILSLSVSLPKNKETSSAEGSNSNVSPVVTPVVAPVSAPFVSPVASPVTAPASAPRQATIEQVIDFLSTRNISLSTDLTNRTSPQHGAALFLANHDGLNLPVPVDDNDVDSYITRYVVALVHHALDGYNWAAKVNFMSAAETCLWSGPKLAYNGDAFAQTEPGGFFCETDTMLPIKLDLEFNSLKGSIPTELGLLTTLISLDLEFNYITGIIPTELCKLTKLRYLSLRGNELDGLLPECMGQWTDLSALSLELNQLSGSLPQGNALCKMTKLESVLLQRNILSGSIPTCIGKWTRLNDFFVSENFFKGQIPTEILSLTNLTQFLVDNNELTGNPTTLFSDMKTLEFLYLDNNKFTGVIDSTFLANTTGLVVLDLSHNNFTLDATTQLFPLHLLQHPSLQILDVSVNRLNGSLPSSDLQVNDQLVFFSMHTNSMNGKIPHQLRQFTQLLHLDLSDNSFSGALPNQLFSMTLENLFVSENPTLEAGTLPDTILGNHTGFREISLRNTQRTGPLPSFFDFVDLELLDLGSNDFSGAIPSQYSELPSLRYLLLNRNPNLTGAIPVMSQSKLLQVVLLDDTGIYGDFSSICSLAAFQLDSDVAVVNCNTTAGVVSNCDCCKCCYRPSGGCSDPIVGSLDWTWELKMARSVRDFVVNETLLMDMNEL